MPGELVEMWDPDAGWIVESSVAEGIEVFVLDSFVADFGDGSCFGLQSRAVLAGLGELSGGPLTALHVFSFSGQINVQHSE